LAVRPGGGEAGFFKTDVGMTVFLDDFQQAD
jgi:hypothetical protein